MRYLHERKPKMQSSRRCFPNPSAFYNIGERKFVLTPNATQLPPPGTVCILLLTYTDVVWGENNRVHAFFVRIVDEDRNRKVGAVLYEKNGNRAVLTIDGEEMEAFAQNIL